MVHQTTARARIQENGGEEPAIAATAAETGPPLPPPIEAALRRTSQLSGREQAVFELLGLGYDNRSLARELRVSERTAKRHVTAILAKLGLESRLQAGLTALLDLTARAVTPGRAGREGPWSEGRVVLPAPGPDTESWDGCTRCGSPLTEPEPPGYSPGGSAYMAFDALAALRESGSPVDRLSSEQQAVFAELTEDEVAVLISVQQRLDAVSDAEVEGHGGIKIA